MYPAAMRVPPQSRLLSNQVYLNFRSRPDIAVKPKSTTPNAGIPRKNISKLHRRVPTTSQDEGIRIVTEFVDALALQFNANFGTDERSLLSWHKLCSTLGIRLLPQTLKEAKEKVVNTHVNLVDMLDSKSPKIEMPIFQSLEDLREYTIGGNSHFEDTRFFLTRLIEATPVALVPCLPTLRLAKIMPEGNAASERRRSKRAALGTRRKTLSSPYPTSSQKRGKKKGAERREGPLQTFFDEFSPAFVYNPTQPVKSEYDRLEQFMCAVGQHWNKRDAKIRFQNALVAQFNKNYGKDVNSLTGWQTLCATLKIVPVPDELEKAKEAVLNKHVNLVDLTDAYDGIRGIQAFNSELELSEYTRRNKLFFPRERVPPGTLLYFLLRRIFNPPPIGSHRNAQGNIIVPRAPGSSNEKGKKKEKRSRAVKKRKNGSSGSTEA
ncbi:hypothetical protein FA15DRAFT_696102 [Coprinopsis marcescibilis]|uniref:Uncharacterized protein n=1 Tax=Coprinopsis marcescibilis TaxID=230819 RepID=A0A5C3KNF0_COPMA|nr:hypothetical protein FA15DRAFT_696102 [Coprinopsis marcescibilis]